MQNIFRFPLHLTNGSRLTCCCSSCMQSGEVQFRSCRLFCPVHETSISPQVTESGLRLRFNEQSPPFSALSSTLPWSGAVTAWQISTFIWKYWNTLLRPRPLSIHRVLKWWPPLPPHLTLSCINWILSNLETFLPDLNQLAAGGRGWVEGREYLGGRRMFHSITSPILVAGLMNIYGYCCSPVLAQQVPCPLPWWVSQYRPGNGRHVIAIIWTRWCYIKPSSTQYCHLESSTGVPIHSGGPLHPIFSVYFMN